MEENYTFKIYFPGENELDKTNEAVDLIVKKDGKEYTGSLITLRHLNELFVKNQGTRECANGSYFPILKQIVIRNLEKETIKKTLDDLIKRNEFDYFFN